MTLAWVEAMRITAKTGKRSSFLARLLTTFSGICLALTCAAPPRKVLAEEPPRPPADVLGSRSAALELPALPKEFVEERAGRGRWAFHPSDTDLVAPLEREFPAEYRRINHELGADAEAEAGDEIVIRIARSPEDMRALSPKSAPPPAYAVGVAYPALGLIVLSVVNPQSWFPPDLSQVLSHELSHIALHRAVQGHALPLWFVEGMAVHQAGEQNLQRVRTLWEAAAVDEVLPLSALSRNFPARPHEGNRAYAQSADLVEHLLRNHSDRERLPELLHQVAEGASFEQAILSAYHIDLAYLDREWRQALGERFRVLPLVLTGTALWGGIAVLAVVAFVRRRREHHAKLARWAEEEAAHERALQALELRRQAPLRLDTGDLAREVDEDAAREAHVVPSLPGDPGIPTIDYEGQRHTLH